MSARRVQRDSQRVSWSRLVIAHSLTVTSVTCDLRARSGSVRAYMYRQAIAREVCARRIAPAKPWREGERPGGRPRADIDDSDTPVTRTPCGDVDPIITGCDTYNIRLWEEHTTGEAILARYAKNVTL